MNLINKIIFILILGLSLNLCQASILTESNNHFIAPKEFSTTHFLDWAELVNKIKSSSSKVIYISWSGRGGDIDFGLQFIEFIKAEQAKGRVFVFSLNNNAYSMHAIVSCYADRIERNDEFFLMYHPALKYTGKPYVGSELNFLFKVSAPCVAKNLLSIEDLTKSLNKTEVYVKKVNNTYDRRYLPDKRQQ